MKAQHLALACYMSVSGVFLFYNFFNNFYHNNHHDSNSRLFKRNDNSTGAVSLNDREAGTAYSVSNTLRLMSWNLRNGKKQGNKDSLLLKSVPSDDEASKLYYKNADEIPWNTRSIELVQQVLFYLPDVFAVQEALQYQVESIADALTEYSWVGVGRDDNKTSGEYEAIFYKKSILTVNKWNTFWLSDDPFKPTKYKGAGSIRSATVVNFNIVQTGLPVTFINTHWDEKSDDARKLGAALIRYRGAYEYEKFQGPVFLTGDFNSKADGKTSGGYEVVTSSGSIDSIDDTFKKTYKSSISDKFFFKDFYSTVDWSKRLGHFSTFTGFYDVAKTNGFGRIDFHMGGRVNGAKANGWAINRMMVPDTFPDIKYHLSDHRPVISDITVSRLKA